MADIIPPAHNTASIFADMRGHHVAVRVPSLAQAKAFYVGKLDFRVVAEWDFGDQDLAYLAPPTDDHFYIEFMGGGTPAPLEARPYADAAESMTYRGYHHVCLAVSNIEQTIENLRERGVTIIAEPFVLDAINRKLAFFCDPFGNLLELAEVLA